MLSGTLLNWVFGFPMESLTINTDNIPHKDISQLFYGGEGVKNCRGPSGNECDSSINEVLGFGFPVESLEGDMMSKASNQVHAAEKRKYRKNKYYFLYNRLLDKPNVYLYYIDGYKKWNRSSQTTLLFCQSEP